MTEILTSARACVVLEAKLMTVQYIYSTHRTLSGHVYNIMFVWI